MVWLWLIASILGFLAVKPLASNQSFITLPTFPKVWLICTLFCLILCAVLQLAGFFRHRLNLASRFLFLSQKFLPHKLLCKLAPLLSFILCLLASTSFGLYQYFHYQQSLVSQPMTVVATIRSQTISDTISLANPSITQAHTPPTANTFIVGNGYQRQVWQVISIQPFFDETVEDGKITSDTKARDENIETELSQDSSKIKLPINVLVTANVQKNPEWLPILNTLPPNQTLQVKLALEPITQPSKVSSKQFSQVSLGFDESLWLRGRDIQAKAQLIQINPKLNKNLANPAISIVPSQSLLQPKAEVLRWQLRQKMLDFLQTQLSSPQTTGITIQDTSQATAILLSLLTGDSGLVSSDSKRLYQVTGISHLLAISGPHVMMLASVVAFLLVVLLKWLKPAVFFRLPAQLWVLWISVAVSFGYALLVGFELPAQRTVWMLLLVTLSVQWLLPISAYRVLAWVGLGMLWLDTTAVMQAGFWLSFVAVGLLIKFSQSFTQETVASYHELGVSALSLSSLGAWLWQGLTQLLLLQIWLFVLMMPVVLWFFGKISLMSIAVNLIAVPFLGLIIVPLDMLAGVLAFLPVLGEGLSQGIWRLLSQALMLFHHGLQSLVETGFAKQMYIGLSTPQLIVLAMTVIILLLPKRIIPKLLALPLFMAVLAIGYHARQTATPQLIVLDESRLSIQLLVNQENSWLILADNHFAKNQQKQHIPSDILDNKLYPLLAKYNVSQLKGVISQTPSRNANDFIQSLAKTIPIQEYWLAGFNPLMPNSTFNLAHITPKTCQIGQKTALDTVQMEAVSGWSLAPEQLGESLSESEQWQTQTCFIRLQTPKKSLLVMAGDNDVPMQMSQRLCQVIPVDTLITPAVTPIAKEWLQLTKPSNIHVISSRYSQPSEDSQFAIAGFIEDHSKKNTQLTSTEQVGTVAYGF